MKISIPPNLESVLQAAAQAGGYEDVSEFVAETMRQKVLADERIESGNPPEQIPYDQWRARFDEFLRHRRATNIDFRDDRESMYFDPA